MIATLLFGTALMAELHPTGKWQLDYKLNLCTLARRYGDKVIGVEWQPIARSYKLFEFDQSIHKTPRRNEQVDTLILPSGPIKGILAQFDAGERGRLTTIVINGDPAAMLDTASMIRLVDHSDRPAYVITNGVQAARALRSCRDDWLRQMGESVEAYTNIATPAQPINLESWISVADYPVGALRAHQQGDVFLMWHITVSGKVENCRIVETAGFKPLDDAACKAITTRGRYVPAKDAAGQPIGSIDSRVVQWRLPY